MPVFTYNPADVPAGATIENILAGTKWEFPSRPTAVRVFATENLSATGGAATLWDLTVANVVVGENLDPPDKAYATGGAPIRPDDLLVEGMALPGQRIQIRVRNTDAANAKNVRALVEFIEQ